jgi:hypothetical protein
LHDGHRCGCAQVQAPCASSTTWTIAEWEATPVQSAFFRWTTPITDGVDVDMFSMYDFSTTVSLRGGAGGSLTYGAGSFRCDNAPTFVRQSIPSGCVFPTTGRFQRLPLSDPAIAQASNHVWTAIFDPNSTNPPGDNKVIVGGLNSLTPLTRVTDEHTTGIASR